MSQIEVKKLSKSFTIYHKKPGLSGTIRALFRRDYEIKEAVKPISFKINKGEIVGFIGPNGAGKTTTLKMLSGILYPTTGSATVMGHVPWERNREFQRQFAIVMGQKSQLMWDLPPMDSFLLSQAIYKVPEKQFRSTLKELTNVLKAGEFLQVQTRKLSLGQRMKCEIINSLLHKPKVLFLDEPTIGLDLQSQQAIREFIKLHNEREQTTVILSSHYMEDIARLCKRVIIINEGTIVHDGNLADLMAKHVNEKVLKITFHEPVSDSAWKKFSKHIIDIEHETKRQVRIRVSNNDYKQLASGILNSCPVDDILIDEMSVEDVIGKIFENK